jgi:hypothetical protein
VDPPITVKLHFRRRPRGRAADDRDVIHTKEFELVAFARTPILP